ncbi:hypothetical protein AAHB63_10150 [Bacillus thuringiensis]
MTANYVARQWGIPF